MHIVIDIPEKLYEYAKANLIDSVDETFAIGAIADGTPLPKGHGRLIEADKLKLTQHDIHVEAINYRHRCISIENIDEAPTIVEADRGKEDE